MVKVRGRDAVRRFIAEVPEKLQRSVLPGAARAAAEVIVEEARLRVVSSEVRASIKVSSSRRDGEIIARVQTKGEGAYLAPWLEFGTSPHFIRVNEGERQGRSVRRINQLAREGSLVINGQFVGSTIWHPGASPHPFLRPALDLKEAEAIAAARSYIAARIGRAGITETPVPKDDE